MHPDTTRHNQRPLASFSLLAHTRPSPSKKKKKSFFSFFFSFFFFFFFFFFQVHLLGQENKRLRNNPKHSQALEQLVGWRVQRR